MKNQPSLDQMDGDKIRQLKANQITCLSISSFSHTFEGKTDQQVWRAFQQGHDGAFAFVYSTYFDTLYYYGCQLTQDTNKVTDLLQDFFVDLRIKRGKLSEATCIKAYLLKSFRRKIIRHLKKKKILIFNQEVAESDFTISFCHEMQFMKTQFHEEQQKFIEQMLNRLTTREREAVYYFYFENLDYKSVSQVMGLSSAKSARNLIYKALSGLKKNKHLFPNWLRRSTLLL